MAIPLRGDRSAWDMNYEHLHASDIENEEFLNHVPTSGSSSEGFILHSSGSGWISSDEIIIPVAIKKVSATPSNPDSGYVKFYAKTNDKFYALDSSGNETEFESSGSGAGVYYFTDLLDAPGSYTDQAGKVIAVNETEDGLEFVVQTSGSSSTTFLALTDTPSSFSGQGLKLLRVNTGANAIEFVDPPTVYDQLTDLTDTPANYTGAGGKILAVKSSADGIEFIDAPTSGSDTTAIHDNESGEINAITAKSGLHDNDVFIIEDSEASYAKKKIARSDLYPTWLTYLQADFTDNAGKVVAVNSGEDAFELVTPTSGSGSGAESFTDLDDVPSAYTDQAGKILAVNSGEDALEFVDMPTGGGGTGSDWVGYIDGSLAVLQNVAGALIIPRDCEIESVMIYCEDKGSSGTTIIDINKNGSTIFTTQTGRPQLPYNDADGITISGMPDVVTLTAGDILTLDIDQIAVGAGNLSFIVAMKVVGVNFLSSLEDVDLTGITDGDILSYDLTSDTWLPVAFAGASLTVEEADGTPTVANVTKIKVTNGTLTNDGSGVVSLDFGSAATDGTAIHDNVANEIAVITEKTTLVGADMILVEDSEDGNKKKMAQITNLPSSGGGGETDVLMVHVFS